MFYGTSTMCCTGHSENHQLFDIPILTLIKRSVACPQEIKKMTTNKSSML